MGSQRARRRRASEAKEGLLWYGTHTGYDWACAPVKTGPDQTRFHLDMTVPRPPIDLCAHIKTLPGIPAPVMPVLDRAIDKLKNIIIMTLLLKKLTSLETTV
ncbi:hypothetical protein NDU88_004275 [Pleurodeles waltl]|uniref:Uncharacterized protein n=1 Tax=Pleurodeles waltl TaxID=8319 RepID=A0AAV7NJC5_PLEWA|nr:hypothetical protein NDU88_004275 [Pleurodeles waltl]